MSGSLAWSSDLAGRVAEAFGPSPRFRWITVQPKDRQVNVAPKDRVIVFQGDDRGLSMQEMIKQPAEVVDYLIDMERWFRSIFEDYITDVSVAVDITGDSDDLEVGPGSLAEWEPVGDPVHQAKVWLGGGRDGIEYKVTATVTTHQGRVEEVDFLVIIEEQ